MPRLHKYVSRHAHYVLTSINGTVVTYQLTAAGERRLADAGITDGQPFERALLLDLYRSGDAYARGGEFPEAVLANQLSLDFDGDPHPESDFPTCDGCRSVIDLHLTLPASGVDAPARLQCPGCRAASDMVADTSIPLGLLSRPLVARLFENQRVGATSPNVQRYLALLEAQFARRWEALQQRHRASQAQLFTDRELGGLDLG